MGQMLEWFKEQMGNRKFRIIFIVELALLLLLCAEFIMLQYNLLTIFRYVVLLLGLFALAWIDQERKYIPNKILLMLLAGRFVMAVLEGIAFASGSIPIFISAGLGMVVGGGMFLLCYLFSRGGIGAGDVKLFAVLGSYVGIGSIFTLTFLTVVAAALYSIFMLLLKKKTLKEEIPFAPFILIGTMLTMALGM